MGRMGLDEAGPSYVPAFSCLPGSLVSLCRGQNLNIHPFEWCLGAGLPDLRAEVLWSLLFSGSLLAIQLSPPFLAWFLPCLFCDCGLAGALHRAWRQPPGLAGPSHLRGPCPLPPAKQGSPSPCPAEAGPGNMPRGEALCDAPVAMAILREKTRAFCAGNPGHLPALSALRLASRCRVVLENADAAANTLLLTFSSNPRPPQ